MVLLKMQTYDRPFIQKWLKEGQRTCPQTQQVLSHTVLTPNHLVRELIAQWCKEHGIELPPPIQDADDGVITDADRGHLNSLLEKMSSTVSDQKQAAKEIRLLTKRMPSFRSFFGESTDAIPQLLSPLTRTGRLDDHPDLQEDLITAVLNLSIHDNNKKLIAEQPAVIPLLIESLKCGRIETRTNAAAALFTLSALDSNKHLIGKLGALKPLIDLLEEGHPSAMKDAASAIFNLCVVVENRGRAVRDGAVRVILDKIMDRVLVDELLAILAFLSSHQGAIEELAELGAVGCLLGIIRESTCERNKENCIAILHSICLYNRSKLKEVREEERANRTISKLAEHGTMRAKRKANGGDMGTGESVLVAITAHLSSCRCPVTIIDMSFLLSPMTHFRWAEKTVVMEFEFVGTCNTYHEKKHPKEGTFVRIPLEQDLGRQSGKWSVFGCWLTSQG
ncbi:hypothetical protein Cgig2_015143 [Carnegiea gigantea]|uniref:RING-type E3 ubiquitin transferase n=1 Tax=Carnegiea gigantea TaxID=171969 RepID=A0A9Q1QPN7_9CARY|nr:hypothetical protein Cgig2_015143 [Carnegiea gigantea]